MILTVLIITSCGKEKKDSKKEVKTVKAKKGDIVLQTEASGTVMANFEVQIKAKSSGTIIKLPADIGDFVHKGDLVAELDPIDEQRNVQKAEIQLSTASANREKAEAALENQKIENKVLPKSIDSRINALNQQVKYYEDHYKRQLSLLKKKFISPDEIEQIKVQLENSRNNLTQAKADKQRLAKLANDIKSKEASLILAKNQEKVAKITLEDAKTRLEETKIFSPIDGFISEKDVQLGQIIASGISNVGGGTILFKISDLSKIYIDTAIDESNIGNIKVGNTAIVSVDAYPDKTFKGKVVRIAVKGIIESSIVTFHVLIEVVDKNFFLLKPGMTANVKIITQKVKDVLWLPYSAIREDKNGYYAKNKKGDKLRLKIGIHSFEKYEVKEGISKGDEVLLMKESGAWSAGNNKRSEMRMMH